MSWTEVFPVFTDDMVEEFDKLATPEERAEVKELYDVTEIINPQCKPHLVSFSLYWKPSSVNLGPYPTPTREILQKAKRLGLDLPCEPWQQCVQPLLDTVPAILKMFDDVAARVYLAADLDFLVPDLVDAGCEVYLMRHSSLADSPGVTWRLLAFADEGKFVTMINNNSVRGMAQDLDRTRTMNMAGLGCWREPICSDYDGQGKVIYSAFRGGQMGVVGGWPMEKLLHAFTWHSIRGNLPTMIECPGCDLRPIASGYWPDAGFDEWFLSVAMYPRLAAKGMLTFVPTDTRSSLLLMDIEYVTWANPRSELIIYPRGSTCCGTRAYSPRETVRST